MSKYIITEDEQNKIKTYTAMSMPDNPSERGMSPSAIKYFFYKYLDVFFKVLNDKYGLIENSQDAYEFRNIIYSKYIAPDKYLLNSSVKSISVVPENADCKGDLTVNGMTEYLTDTHLNSPDSKENESSLFYQNQTNTRTNEAGFIIDFGEAKNIGIVQMYVWSIWEGATMNAYVSNDGSSWEKADSLRFFKTPETGVLCVYRFRIGKNAQYLKIVQEGDGWTNGSYAMKGIEIWENNYEGKHQIVQKNGNVIELDSFFANGLVNDVFNYTNKAKEWAESDELVEGSVEDETDKYSAKHWAEESKNKYDAIEDKRGTAGGYAPLENVGTEDKPQLKIPSVYINQFDHKRHIKIRSEDELDGLISSGAAQGGDIAILVEYVYEIDAEGNIIEGTEQEAITKTWLYYAEYDEEEKEIEGTQEWIRYGLSYVTNAGYATYANNAGNAAKINGRSILTVNSTTYEAAVKNGTISDTDIYIVEV